MEILLIFFELVQQMADQAAREAVQEAMPKEDATPAWVLPTISAGAAIVGAAIGGLSSWLVTRSKTKADNARRWDEQIRKYGAEFLDYCDQWQKLIEKEEKLRLSLKRTPKEDAAKQAELREKIRSISMSEPRNGATIARNQLQFVAPKAVHVASREYFAGLLADEIIESQLAPGTKSKLRKSRQKVVNEIRKAIDLPPIEEDREADKQENAPGGAL